MRELFIGNTQPGTNETHLQDFLGSAIQQVGLTIAPGNPIVSTRVSMKFAFIELRSIDEADLMLNLNNIPYLGMPLKVGRPTKYSGPPVQAVSWDELMVKIMTGDMNSLPENVKRVLPPPSFVIRLANMVTLGDLREDKAYEELCEETKEECGR
jgi:RNA recognition motif-containing protein